ncbi:MAG: DUF1559 domain-containing protein [Planctomycetes bacterium]|nr:DUF1559 domain-containing protein [Planctomycetota bacterium]
MVREVTCLRGHRFPLAEEAAADEIRCPRCQSAVSDIGQRDVPNENAPASENASASPSVADTPQDSHGLWQLMSQSGTGEHPPAQSVEAPAPPSEDEEQPSQTGRKTEMLSEKSQKPSEPEAEVESTAADRKESVPSGGAETTPKGLWGMMQSPTPAVESPPDETPQRGLWTMMGHAAVAAPQKTDESSPKTGEPSRSDKAESTRFPPLPDDKLEPVELDNLPASPSSSASIGDDDDDLPVAPLEELELDDVEAAASGLSAAESAEEPQTETAATPPRLSAHVASLPVAGESVKPLRSRGAQQSLLLGLIALPASCLAFLPSSLLAFLPEIWASVPAMILGFSALLVGFLADGEVRRSRGKLRGRTLASIGMTCGVVGMFLGQFVIADWGKRYRSKHGLRETAEHLQSVGTALTAYRKKNEDRFPPGYTKEKSNEKLHNWITLLLPYLGDSAGQIADGINFNRPYDDPVNAAAMKQNVPMFFAAGADRSPLENGFAVTHFVAVGGDPIPLANGRNADVGIFGSATGVARRDVTDGLKHTLVAGEISVSFPAWGKPEEWRSISNRLNGGPGGFGNSDRKGAMFLRADGSVIFLSRDIDLSILKRLSTRNGGERLPPDF